MLANTLTTNEVKDRNGNEVEFQRLFTNNRQTVFSKVGEVPSLPFRLTVQHQEIGQGLKARRRSNFRFDKTVASDIDSTVNVTGTFSVVLDSPVGALNSDVLMRDLVAAGMSFLSTTGAGTTVLFDCSGSGAAALLSGSL